MSAKEILNMKILIGHLDLTTDTKNKLYNQTTKIEDILNKQKEVLYKIKEYIQSLGTQDGMIKDYMIDKNIKETILELLEEIE